MSRGRLACAAVLVAAMLAAVLGIGSTAGAASRSQHAYLSYVRGGEKGPITIWLANADGSGAHMLAAGDQASLSPNGAYVAVQRYASSGAALELYSSSGKLVGSYFELAKDDVAGLDWSPNSRYLVATLTSTKPNVPQTLAVIDTSTLKSRAVASGVFAGASFNPPSSELAYGQSNSAQIPAHVNLFTVSPAGGAPKPLTTNGNSFAPLWTTAGIVFDRSTYRGKDEAPAYQMWIDASGKFRQLTHLRVPALQDGLTAVSASADGNRLLAEYTGEDTSYAWTVQLSPLRVQVLKVDGKQVQGAGISASGQQLLVDAGAFEQAPNYGEVESVGFGGGAPTKLGQGAQPSWSR